MCPPDSPDPRRREESEADEADDDGALDTDLEALKLRGDVSAILALAKAYRAGTAPVSRDMAKCLDAYRAAAELGNGEASFAVALFYLNGGVVSQDLKEAVTHLRAAAEKGSVPAKVYLGNLYELGLYYKADPEKADVWYRNAARGAKVDAAPGSEEFTRALADLGAVRYVLEVTSAEDVDEGERARLLGRAKAHGHGLRSRSDDSIVPGGDADRATFVEALVKAEGAAAAANVATATPPPVAVEIGARERKDTAPETRAAKEKAEAKAKGKTKARGPSANVSAGLGAFGYAILFALAGIGAGYAAMVGAKELVANGQVLPVLGTNVRAVFPIALALIGVLPTVLVYKMGAVAKAIVAAAAFAGIGWVAWGTGQAAFHPDRALQALGFSLGGFLATLLVLGFLGGTKAAKPHR